MFEKRNSLEVLFKSSGGLEIDWELLFRIIVFETFGKESFRIMDNLEFNAFRGISGSVKVNPGGRRGRRALDRDNWLVTWGGAAPRRDNVASSIKGERVPFQQDDLWCI